MKRIKLINQRYSKNINCYGYCNYTYIIIDSYVSQYYLKLVLAL